MTRHKMHFSVRAIGHGYGVFFFLFDFLGAEDNGAFLLVNPGPDCQKIT